MIGMKVIQGFQQVRYTPWLTGGIILSLIGALILNLEFVQQTLERFISSNTVSLIGYLIILVGIGIALSSLTEG